MGDAAAGFCGPTEPLPATAAFASATVPNAVLRGSCCATGLSAPAVPRAAVRGPSASVQPRAAGCTAASAHELCAITVAIRASSTTVRAASAGAAAVRSSAHSGRATTSTARDGDASTTSSATVRGSTASSAIGTDESSAGNACHAAAADNSAWLSGGPYDGAAASVGASIGSTGAERSSAGNAGFAPDATLASARLRTLAEGVVIPARADGFPICFKVGFNADDRSCRSCPVLESCAPYADFGRKKLTPKQRAVADAIRGRHR